MHDFVLVERTKTEVLFWTFK